MFLCRNEVCTEGFGDFTTFLKTVYSACYFIGVKILDLKKVKQILNYLFDFLHQYFTLRYAIKIHVN